MKRVICILPHPDDEWFILPVLRKLSANASMVSVIYVFKDIENFAFARLAESTNIITRFCRRSDIVVSYLDSPVPISDGSGYDASQDIVSALELFFSAFQDLGKEDYLMIPSFEGGHRDHDALAKVFERTHFKDALHAVVLHLPIYRLDQTLGVIFLPNVPLRTCEKYFFAVSFTYWIELIFVLLKYESERRRLIIVVVPMILRFLFVPFALGCYPRGVVSENEVKHHLDMLKLRIGYKR